eukprot:76385-Prymnesium_polylepis.1
MPLASRSHQLSIVLDPALLSQWARRSVRPVCAALQRATGRASGAMSAYTRGSRALLLAQ